MARLFRLSFFFDEPKQGWSENWFFQDANLTLRDFLDRFNNLATLRAALLGNGAKLSHMRVSQVNDNFPGGVKTPRVSLGRDLNLDATTTNKLCAPHDSLLVQCITGDQTKKKPVYLGGVWMRVFDELRHYQPVNDFQTRFDNWANEVKAQGLGWLAQSIDQNLDITNWVSDPVTGKTTYTTSAPVNFAAGENKKRVLVSIPAGHDSLDGIQLVGPIPGPAVGCITIQPRPTHAYDGRIGKLKTFSYSFIPLGPTPAQGPAASIDPQRGARRNRGRPSYAEVGRRSATVRF